MPRQLQPSRLQQPRRDSSLRAPLSVWPNLDGPARGGEGDISGPVDFVGTRYHPESHFWPLQLVESALVLALTAAAIVSAFVLLRRRHR